MPSVHSTQFLDSLPSKVLYTHKPFTAQNFSIATSYLILCLTARHKTICTRKKKKKKNLATMLWN
jgi:hypothetical protein